MSIGTPRGGDRSVGTNRSLLVVGDGDGCWIGVGMGPGGVIVSIFDIKGCLHIGHATSTCTTPQSDSAHFLRHLK